MKCIFVTLFILMTCNVFPVFADDSEYDCLCISSEAVKKHSDKEFANLAKSKTRLDQEIIAKREIQMLIDQGLEADIAKDADASNYNLTEDFTIKDLDGKLWTRAEMKGNKGIASMNYEGIIETSDKTWIKIEALTLKGLEAIVYTNQHFVRYMPDRKDGSPHEVITNIIHREIWIFGENGWKFKHIEELERGKTYLNGQVFDPN
jgi:hypothetical protein